MSSLNKAKHIRTHEGARAKQINPEMQLRRSVMACMLWENSFYEDGIDIARRIHHLAMQVHPDFVASLAVEAREKMKLRHVSLLLVRELARVILYGQDRLVSNTLSRVIQRADELTEFLALYWKDGKEPLSSQVKKGLARAFTKFDAYQLAKYNRDKAIKLRDVLFLCHAKPKDDQQAETWKKLIDGTLEPPDTWEVALSGGGDKKEHWERLLRENKLGALALLRNIRNILQANADGTSGPSYVDEVLLKDRLMSANYSKVLPFRFIAAARYAPNLQDCLGELMIKCLQGREKLPGKTVILVDVSGSMDYKVSGKSQISRMDAACGLAIILREVSEKVEILSFSEDLVAIPNWHGFALHNAIINSQLHYGTWLGKAVNETYNHTKSLDRLIVITDEQSHDIVPDPKGLAYMINVGSDKNGVGYGPWQHIDGWSESIVDYIIEREKATHRE
jgi:hypothetical protein